MPRPRTRAGAREVVAVGAVAVALALVAGCGDDDEPAAVGGGATTSTAGSAASSAPPAPTTTAPDDEDGSAGPTTTAGAPLPPTATTPPPSGPAGLELTQRCTVPGSFSVAYPAGWRTNAAPAPDPCAWFGPDPITVPEFGTDATLAPVNLRVQVRDLSLPSSEVVEAERTVAVDGRPGVRRELRTTEDLLLPAGTRLTTWDVVVRERPEGGSEVLTGVVIDGRTGSTSYAEAVAVLDAMVPTVDLDA